jgi:hypothetical protein
LQSPVLHAHAARAALDQGAVTVTSASAGDVDTTWSWMA